MISHARAARPTITVNLNRATTLFEQSHELNVISFASHSLRIPKLYHMDKVENGAICMTYDANIR